jgi:hypothetical protein
MVGKGEVASVSAREADFYRAMDRATTVLKEDGPPSIARQTFSDLLEAANLFEHEVDLLFIDTHRVIRTIRRLCAQQDLLRWQTPSVFCRTR